MVCHHLNPRIPRTWRSPESRIRRADDRRRGRAARPRARSACSARTARAWAASARRSRAPGSSRRKMKDAARLAAGGRRRRARQPPHQALRRQVHDQRGADLRHRRRTSARSSRASSPTSCSGSRRFFGIKPEVVFKGGFPAWSVMGESNASLMTCEPLLYRPQWGAFGRARQATSADVHGPGARSTRASPERLGLRKARSPRRASTRALTKARHAAQRRAARRSRSTRRPTASRWTASSAPASRSTRVPLAAMYVLK